MKTILILFGLSSGITVGAGVVSILIIVGIIPRMAQISNTKSSINIYESLLVIGTFIGSILSLHTININLNFVFIIIMGLAYGVFVGFLSSGLAEIIDYIPTISRRLKIPALYLKYIVISLLIGKVIGSLVGWKII